MSRIPSRKTRVFDILADVAGLLVLFALTFALASLPVLS